MHMTILFEKVLAYQGDSALFFLLRFTRNIDFLLFI